MNRYNCGLIELKVAADEGMTFSGYGAVFGNVDYYGDVIAPGAFAETLSQAKAANQWPAMLLQHGGWEAESMTPVGIWTEMREDSIGLYVDGKLAETERGKEMYALLKMEPRPAINGMSIGYIAKEWSVRTKPEEPKRTLKAVDLIEVSLVTFPANPKARVTGVKSELSIREAERALRDAGFSRSEAKTILARGYDALSLRDADEEGREELAAFLRRNIKTLMNEE